MKSAQRVESRQDHPHGMRVVGERLDGLHHGHGQRAVAHHRLLPLRQLCGVGQVAVDGGEGRLEVRGLLSQLFDGVSAVAQDAGVAVDVRDLGLARRRVHVTRVVHLEPHAVAARLDGLDGVAVDEAALMHGHLVLLARAVVEDGKLAGAAAGLGADLAVRVGGSTSGGGRALEPRSLSGVRRVFFGRRGGAVRAVEVAAQSLHARRRSGGG
mmetsp:Transcript_34874/g.85402  ORF Transcript_34874/g.85402 Transcript_34874/m.85402 type:complete len:212 (-) Transcript_34874:273-908(-)